MRSVRLQLSQMFGSLSLIMYCMLLDCYSEVLVVEHVLVDMSGWVLCQQHR
jgi:hypothetical protein